MAKTLIKWPGGKTSELEQILPKIPPHKRYIEPFFGGGAVYFALEPKKAVINDISHSLMEFYVLVKDQDEMLHRYFLDYRDSFAGLQYVAEMQYEALYDLYAQYRRQELMEDEFCAQVEEVVEHVLPAILKGFSTDLVKDPVHFQAQLSRCVTEKLLRTADHENKAALPDSDRVDCFITGFTSGYYMYFRDIFNDIQLNRGPLYNQSYRVANYYFVREYCYGSMFRYNRAGEFNIPYGGISYNRKNFQTKIDNIFCQEIQKLFADTEIYCQDFETLMRHLKLTEDDFMFLDPPYDTDFSDYEGKEFAKHDHERLAGFLSETKAKFLLVIKNTEFISQLYRDKFYVTTFDNLYSYNVKSRNDRKAEHLIVTNFELS